MAWTWELKTKAGKRKYFCRKALFQIAKNAGLSNVSVREEQEMQLVPILFESQTGTIGYVYLDGKTRNFKELGKWILLEKFGSCPVLSAESKRMRKQPTGDFPFWKSRI